MKAPRLIEGDCLVELPKLAAAGVRYHAVITDPPYHLTSIVKRFGGENAKPAKFGTDGAYARASKGFMSKTWDGGDIAFRPETWRAVYDVLLPGGYMVCFASTRGYHRMVCAIEDAGFTIHPMLAWIFATGFPKATDVSRMIDKQMGAERPNPSLAVTASAAPEAAQWEGWKYGLQSLKPAIEPICLAQKSPAKGGMIQNILKHGTGAININATRIAATDSQLAEKYESVRNAGPRGNAIYGSDKRERSEGNIEPNALGRWPANVVHDGSGEVEAAFAAFGPAGSNSGNPSASDGTTHRGTAFFGNKATPAKQTTWETRGGTASRFFTQCPFTEDELRFHYSGKADKGDRADSSHPTVKPQSLLSWLCKLITPPGGHILDPFAGSGGTAEAAMRLGFDCTLIEKDPQSASDIRHRIKRWSGLDTPLFAEPTS